MRRRNVLRPWHIATILAVCLAPWAVLAKGQDAAPQPGHHWAILIGVENYAKASPLRYTVNDAQKLAQTLQNRAGFEPAKIVTFVDTNRETAFRPLRESLLNELPHWLRKPAAQDDLIVYFSGHGFRAKDGRLYLAPLDIDPKDPAATGISVEWLREQLASCRARVKFLVLDACHAGSEKGDEEAPVVAAKDLGEPFREVEGVVTLASSTADEKSLIWEERQQSLFSYWLNQALEGHADVDGDGTVDFDELNKYVHRNVTQTAKARFQRSQTPVRIMRGLPGVPHVVRLTPLSLNQLLSDMAEQLVLAMEEKQIQKVGVLFTADTPVNEGVRGTFGKSCAIKLQDQLMQASGGKIAVVDGDRLIKTFKDSGFTMEDLASGEALQVVSQKLGGLPVIARVQLRHRHRQVTSLHCSLVQTGSAELVGSAGGIAWLNESEWGMLGHSAALAQHERPAPGPNDQETLFARLDKQAREPHPLSDAKFPYRVNFLVNGKPVRGTFKNNEMWVPMKAGDQFEMIVENNTRDMICMRLLVDGLNTLPELDTGTSAHAPSTSPSAPASGSQIKGVETYITAKPVKLDEARHWILDPRINNGRFRIAGFSSKTGTDGEFRRFVVVDASESLAAKLGFKEQIGVVTAAFYQAVLPRGVGVVPGPAEPAYIPVLKDIRVGNPIAVLNIRYGEP